MAIIPYVPGFKAEILVNGLPLTEYTDEDDDEATLPTKVVRYVECVSGAKFAIRYSIAQFLYPGTSLAVEIYLDGKYADSAVLNHVNRAPRPITHHGARSEENGSWKEKAFQFADLVTTEGGAGVKPSPELSDLGSIRIQVRRVIEIPHYRSTPSSHHLQTDLKPIPEKHLKGQALSHQVKLGEAKSISWLRVVGVRNLDAGPIWTIQFQYRSHRSLQSLCMIPRSPTPVPLEDRPREDLTREELLELLRRQERNHEEQIKIKKELKRERPDDNDDDQSNDDDVVLVSSKRPKVIESIDLTDD